MLCECVCVCLCVSIYRALPAQAKAASRLAAAKSNTVEAARSAAAPKPYAQRPGCMTVWGERAMDTWEPRPLGKSLFNFERCATTAQLNRYDKTVVRKSKVASRKLAVTSDGGDQLAGILSRSFCCEDLFATETASALCLPPNCLAQFPEACLFPKKRLANFGGTPPAPRTSAIPPHLWTKEVFWCPICAAHSRARVRAENPLLLAMSESWKKSCARPAATVRPTLGGQAAYA